MYFGAFDKSVSCALHQFRMRLMQLATFNSPLAACDQQHRETWNKAKLVGQKPPLKPLAIR